MVKIKKQETKTGEQMKSGTKDEIIVVLGAIVLAIIVYMVVSTAIDLKLKSEIELNKTLANATLNGYWQGVYGLAQEQIRTGNIYYINQSGSLEFKSLKELCGK